MSWIKKIFTKFQNDNDDEFTGMDQDQPVSKPLKSEKSEKRDIEAKVLYQYPKGQFRFPLIPDENPAPEKTKPRKERQERASQVDEIKPFIKEQGSLRMMNDRQSGSDPLHDPYQDPVVDARSTFRREPNRKPKEASRPNKTEEPAAKFHYETRKDSGPKFRQPFRPTEIPSPIYAFNRPPSKSKAQTNLEDVEFELTGFERRQAVQVDQTSQTDTNRLPQAPAVEALPDSTKAHNDVLTQEIYIEDDLAETRDFEVSELEEQVEQWDLESEAIDIILNNEPDFSHEEPKIETLTEAGNELVVKEPAAISYQHDQEKIEVIDSHPEPEEIEVIDSNLEPEEIKVIDSHLDLAETIYQDSHVESEAGSQQIHEEQKETDLVPIPEGSEQTGLQHSPEDSEETDFKQSEEESETGYQQSEEESETGYQQSVEEPGTTGYQQRVEETETITYQQSVEEPETTDYHPIAEDVYGQPVNVHSEQNTDAVDPKEVSDAEPSQAAEPKIENKPAEQKRQLPFNVLMLKQDKRKWEARNTSKYPSFMTEGRKTGGTEQSESKEIHPDFEGSASAQKNKAGEEELSSDRLPDVHPVQEKKQSTGEHEMLTVAETQTQPEALTVSAGAEEDGSKAGVLSGVNPEAGPSVLREEKSQAEPTVANPSSIQVNGQSEREVGGSPEHESTLQHDVHPAAVYDFPPLDLLSPPVFKAPDPEWLSEQEHMLNETLRNFNVGARVVNVTQGPSVTRFEVQPEPGVKVNKITNLSDDIKLSLAAKDIRIEAPIPGKHTIGIEVPNHSSRPVLLSEILQSAGFMDLESPLSVALGLDIAGNPIVTDLKKMPHGLIAGATGSGKSVCINTMLVSLLYKAHPDEVKLLLIDPKMVELAPYNRIPHLVSPVITDVKAATASLKWAVEEMERRYELFAHTGVRDISRFNEIAEKHRRFSEKLPYIVIVIDELADLMMMAPGDVEEAICRIAQKARACGIHLIIATQRPSVDVITGLIKANVPTRIAFSVSSQVDSRTIIDIGGAEKLLGRGDMLFLENGSSKPFRLQGTFVTDNEIDDIVAFVREQRDPQYLFEQDELLKKAQVTEDEDELFYEACEFVIDQGGASTSSVQRRFKIGYNRAARLIEMMEQQGFISEGKGSKPRDVLITAADLEAFQESSAFN
ncbi:DNA translocase FtsK [Bacillus sp. ISL-41]|uniref:DNA translocase FtsK n=1 Tax=Bacillus sp. ISL-41 TaxID=2819127 RepID=UPI002034B16A|nr:DNA translocase FtsK [Bacillus sp. ISL-41]